MNELERLREKINEINQSVYNRFSSQLFGQPKVMTKSLAEVKKVFDAPASNMPERSIAKSLEGYRNSGRLQSFLDLKYACFGVGMGLADGWCLFIDDPLFFKLLDQVKDLQSEPRRFRKCYQGLLSSYFRYEIFTSESQKNWIHLRKYLADCLPDAKQATPVPGWLTLLEEHWNLLGPRPCERYVKEIREGNSDGMHETLQEGIGVPRESWVWQELVLSQFEVANSHDDQGYKDDLDRLLKLLQDNSGMLSKNLVIRCIALLISRYAQCSSKPEHPALRDAAVFHIGNPWLKKTAWDAHVKTLDGQPHEAARQMINGWIKRELIKNFFELLSDDGFADQRRLNYWLRFEPVVDDMWFALGPHANNHTSPYFKDFRNRARGRLLKLEASGLPQNNAFIMRLGALTAVEFGSKGNATYMYQSDKLPFDLGGGRIRGDGSGLKNQLLGERFFHRDSMRTGTNWEEKFDTTLCPRIGFWPTKKRLIRRRASSSPQSGTMIKRPESPAPQSVVNWEKEVKVLSDLLKLPTIDSRSKGGAFWVMVDRPSFIELAWLGFKFKPGKGWWKE